MQLYLKTYTYTCGQTTLRFAYTSIQLKNPTNDMAEGIVEQQSDDSLSGTTIIMISFCLHVWHILSSQARSRMVYTVIM